MGQRNPLVVSCDIGRGWGGVVLWGRADLSMASSTHPELTNKLVNYSIVLNGGGGVGSEE